MTSTSKPCPASSRQLPHLILECPLVAILIGLVLLSPGVCTPVQAQEASPSETAEEGFRPLFNGRDLTGWVPVNVGPETFTVRDGMIVCSGVPTGVLRSDRQYENFVLELEWRHLKPGGNAGLFVWSYPRTAVGVPFTRSIEVQILDGRNTENYTSHGDVFPIQGATFTPDRPHPQGWNRCLPAARRCRPSPQWNHYRVTCQDGRIQLAVNGQVVSGGTAARPRKGYICLESEGGLVHFRNLRIKELPSTQPNTAEVAPPSEGFRALYNGVDLSGWRIDPASQGHWQADNWILRYDGKSPAADPHLWTEESFGDFELICDWRWTGEPQPSSRPVLLPSGDYQLDERGERVMQTVADAGDSGIYLRGNSKSQVNIWCWPIGSGEVYGYREDQTLPAEVRAAVTPRVKADRPIGEWNRFRIRMKGERLTVVLNDQTVIDQARLPGVPRSGPIALQHHGHPIEFANIYIKELTPAGE